MDGTKVAKAEAAGAVKGVARWLWIPKIPDTGRAGVFGTNC